jgi:tetratricopeptide (TPR) repeat protein
LAVVVVALGVRTFARNADWRNELTLWTATVGAAPASFKSHSGLAEALRQADKAGANHDRVVAEKEQSLSILDDVPDPSKTSKALYEAAVYHMERGEWRAAHANAGATSADSAADYKRAIELAEKYLALNPSEQDAAAARLLLAAAYRHGAQGDKAIELAREAAAARPLDPVVYTALASSLIVANRQDDAASELMTGFMITGNPSLRAALVDLYRGGLDRQRCAVTTTATGVVLNVDCEIVRRHLCTASAAAARVQRQRSREDLAESALRAVANLNCAASPS